MMLTNLKRYVEALSNARDLMSRMPETNAMVGVHALRKLPELLQWKQDSYNKYKMAFPDFQFQEGEGNHQVIGMLMDSKEQRDKVFDMLKDEIEFKTYYEPLHLKNKQSSPLPTTEDVFNRILCLPSWYKVDIDYIIESIWGVLER
jgi:dTDP-4-amino-4,6-dideoxygalactose transaminase